MNCQNCNKKSVGFSHYLLHFGDSERAGKEIYYPYFSCSSCGYGFCKYDIPFEVQEEEVRPATIKNPIKIKALYNLLKGIFQKVGVRFA